MTVDSLILVLQCLNEALDVLNGILTLIDLSLAIKYDGITKTPPKQ